MTKYLIIGTGVAGVSAAETIRAKDPAASIALIGNEPEVYYSRPGLAYLLTGEIPEDQLYPFQKEDFARLRLNVITGVVLEIHPDSHRVSLDNGRTVNYDRLLIATGASARQARYPGIELEGVVKLDDFSDARWIIKLAKRAKNAVVVGGGITALELVEGLVARGVKVHYLLRRDRYWGNVLDESESQIIEHRLKEEGVRIYYNTELEEIRPKKGGLLGRGTDRVGSVLTTDKNAIPCEIVAIAIGIVPRTGLARDAGLTCDRGILVTDFMQTSDPDIFAAGDVAQVFDPLTGKSVLDSLWPAARDQGAAAGLNMAGFPTSYRKIIPLNVTRLAGLTTTIIGAVGSKGEDDDTVGIVRGDSEVFREIPDAIASQSGFDVNRIRITIGATTLLGALILGDQTLSQPIYKIVSGQMDITAIRDALIEPGADVAAILTEFWRQNGKRP